MAGGWRGLERRDDCFVDDAESCSGAASGGPISCCGDTSSTIASAPAPQLAAGPAHEEEVQATMPERSNGKAKHAEERREQLEWLAKRSEQTDGRAKQLEVARQHLFWMLEKKGHGRTVRFVHLGPYGRHTDLLNDVKNASSLDVLTTIARGCLGGVYWSAIYSNDSYD